MDQEMAIRIERDELVNAVRSLRRSLRLSKGITLREFSSMAGVTATQMSEWTCEPIDRPPDIACQRRSEA